MVCGCLESAVDLQSRLAQHVALEPFGEVGFVVRVNFRMVAGLPLDDGEDEGKFR